MSRRCADRRRSADIRGRKAEAIIRASGPRATALPREAPGRERRGGRGESCGHLSGRGGSGREPVQPASCNVIGVTGVALLAGMLPPLNADGDLPAGVHRCNWAEVEQRFGSGSAVRQRAMANLQHLHELAARTKCLVNFYVFGSFVSRVAEPRDVDVVLVMAAGFKLEGIPRASRTLFSHAAAQARYGASVFWIREGMLPPAKSREFLIGFQTRRDGTLRGILEIA